MADPNQDPHPTSAENPSALSGAQGAAVITKNMGDNPNVAATLAAGNATLATNPPAPVIPPATKETFLEKADEDIEQAYHWLVAEIHKLYIKK
jgi:hypothetical protein